MDNLAKRLGLKSEAEREAERQEGAARLKNQIRQSDQTVMVLGKQVPCIAADGVPTGDYQWTGSGLVFWAGKIIERM